MAIYFAIDEKTSDALSASANSMGRYHSETGFVNLRPQ